MTLAKKWRAYKSRLKKKYYNRNTRSLDEILKDVPRGVNEHQWHSLVGIWCQDSHTVLCLYFIMFKQESRICFLILKLYKSSLFVENMSQEFGVCKAKEEFAYNREKGPCSAPKRDGLIFYWKN
jgi:hypothetical protein